MVQIDHMECKLYSYVGKWVNVTTQYLNQTTNMQILTDIRHVTNRKSHIPSSNELNSAGLKKEIGVTFESFSHEHFQTVRLTYLKWRKKTQRHGSEVKLKSFWRYYMLSIALLCIIKMTSALIVPANLLLMSYLKLVVWDILTLDTCHRQWLRVLEQPRFSL